MTVSHPVLPVRRHGAPIRHRKPSTLAQLQSPAERVTEKLLFLGVGAAVALVGYGLFLGLTEAGMPPSLAEAVQVVVTLQLSFLGNDRLTYRRRLLYARTSWFTRWLGYQAGRATVAVLTVVSFVPLNTAMGHQAAFWCALVAGAVANYAADSTISHRGPTPNAVSRWFARNRRMGAVTVMALVSVATGALCVMTPDWVVGLSSGAMVIVSLTTLAFQLYAWRTPETSVEDDRIVAGWPDLRIVIFLAARKESTVLAATLERMVHLRHPNYFVCVIIDHRDDFDTLAIAREYAARYPYFVRIVAYPDVSTSSKPIALNEAMRVLLASGEHWDVVGVADAEDCFHIDLLGTVDHLFRTKHPGIVQGAVQLVNYSVGSSGHHIPEGYLVSLARRMRFDAPDWLRRLDRTGPLRRRVQHLASGWWRAANCLEYFKWFSSRLKLQASVRVMPLGGNTVFFSREFMEALHQRTGTWWDESCLTEDCKIGIVASILDFTVEVFSMPEMATLEETPASLPKFVKQRIRWMQGFIQVFFENEWHHLPTLRQRVMAVYVLGFQFFQAATGVLAPVGVVYAVAHKAPTPLVLLSVVPALIGVWNIVIDLLMFRDFLAAYGPARAGDDRRRSRHRMAHVIDYCGLALGSYLFQIVLAVSAVGAIYRTLAGITNWVKTDHSGAHFSIDLSPRETVGVR